jgi:SAM-dependent methyltransferase
MKSEYELIFEQRGQEYDAAMQRFPLARKAEFERLFDEVDFSSIKHLADIPSGGGYLRAFAPEHCEIDYIEPCGDFRPDNAHQVDVGLDEIVLPIEAYDLIVCLAAIHHVKAKRVFLNNMYKALKPGAYLCIGDVLRESPIANFLDHFAGKHNGTGHAGRYLEIDTVPDILEPGGSVILTNEEKRCSWRFSDEADMLAFCRLLFGLKNLGNQDLLRALEEYVGVLRLEDGVALDWRLLYVTVKKPG